MGCKECQAKTLKDEIFKACIRIMASNDTLSDGDVEFLKYALPLFVDELKSQKRPLNF